MTSYRIFKTSLLGDLLLVANPTQLLGVYFADRPHALIQKDWKRQPAHPILKQAAAQLREYFNGKRKQFSVPLACTGTPFQEETWRQIARIPFGETISYSELAQRVGSAKAVRAAGTATGKNPLGIIIPCHRVVGKNGGPGGYAGGLERKARLLAIEKIIL